MFGKCGLRLIQLSFSFRESSAIFTDLSFFTVIITCDTKQSSSTLFTFSRCPAFNSFSSSRPTSSCRCSGIGLAFCYTGYCPGFSCIFISVSFIVRLFSNRSGNLLITFSFSDWLVSVSCILPIVSLNFFMQSNNGVISVLSVISISIFCLLFRIPCLPVSSPGKLLHFCLRLGIGLLFSGFRSSSLFVRLVALLLL